MKDYIFSNDFSKNIDAMIYTCGYENCEPGHSYSPLLRNGYLVHYVLSGRGIYQTRGKTFRLGEGDAFLICPGELIYYEANRETPWIYTWIGMQGIKVKGYLARTSLPDCLVFQYGEDSRLRACHERLFEADQQSRGRDLPIQVVARSVSYQDALYFSKLFHQKKGVSPSEYRERHRDMESG